MYDFGVFFKKICIFSVLCSALILFANALTPSAQRAILLCANNGVCLYEKNADEPCGMASTTKIMTALLAIESGNLDTVVTVPEAAVGVEGSSLYLKRNEKMTLRDLVYGLMLRSANDAAEAIAITLGGSVENFANLMNQKANALHLENTHFTNPHGLADENHYTTAKDLAMLAAYALENATFREICSCKKTFLSGDRLVINHNKMLFTYEGACGVKTGFTKATGRCLVSAAERDGVRLIAVTLNAPDDWRDHTAMLDYGFSLIEAVPLVKTEENLCSLPILGSDTENIPVRVNADIVCILPKQRGSIVERIELRYPRFAPVYVGDPVGVVRYMLDGKEIAAAPLYAAEYAGAIF